MNRRRLLTALQILVSGACLIWLGSQPDIREGLPLALKGASPGWILAGLAFAGLVIALGVIRWQWFLRIQGLHISWSDNIKLSFIGAFFNLILIGTVGGDAVKTLYLTRRFPGRGQAAILSILMDHLCGLPAVALMYAGFSLSRWDWLARSGLSASLALFAGAYLAVSLAGVTFLFMAAALRLPEHAPARAPLRRQAIQFSRAWALFLRHGRTTAAAVALSFPIHWLYFATFHAAARALETEVRLLDMFTLMPIVDVITTMPVSVSGLGVRETLFESFLNQLCEVPSETAVMISLLGFGFTVFWSLAGGLVFPGYRPESGSSSSSSNEAREPSLRGVIHEARHLDGDRQTAASDGPGEARPGEEKDSVR